MKITLPDRLWIKYLAGRDDGIGIGLTNMHGKCLCLRSGFQGSFLDFGSNVRLSLLAQMLNSTSSLPHKTSTRCATRALLHPEASHSALAAPFSNSCNMEYAPHVFAFPQQVHVSTVSGTAWARAGRKGGGVRRQFVLSMFWVCPPLSRCSFAVGLAMFSAQRSDVALSCCQLFVTGVCALVCKVQCQTWSFEQRDAHV